MTALPAPSGGGPLADLEQAERLLATCATVEDAAWVVREAEAARVLARQVKLGTGAINHATSVKVRAELKLADLVDAEQAEGRLASHGGDRRSSSVAPTLNDLGLTRTAVLEARTLRDSGLTDLEVVEQAQQATKAGHEIARGTMLSKARRQRRQQVDRDARSIVPPDDGELLSVTGDGWTLLGGPAADALADWPAASVDLIVTDPPYPAEHLDRWSLLGDLAARLLVPQGILVALTGKILLPDVLSRLLASGLSWGWEYCQPLPGSNSRILARQVLQTYKPWLAFSNGPWPSGMVDWHEDTLPVGSRDKGTYAWQQAGDPASYLIGHLSPRGGVVLDPFVGTGTYGVAALEAGRRFVGVEADVDRFALAAQRLANACTTRRQEEP